jgi:hypothetical protein
MVRQWPAKPPSPQNLRLSKRKKSHNSVNTIQIELLSTDMEISSIFTPEQFKRKKKYYFLSILKEKWKVDFF